MSSSRRSAFHVLMSNASKKKKTESETQPSKPQKSSPIKNKAPAEISQTPKLNPNDGNYSDPIEIAAGKRRKNVENSNSDQIVDCHGENLSNNNGDGSVSSEGSTLIHIRPNDAESNGKLVVKKKPRVSISLDDSLIELKKKAANFNVKKAVYWKKGEIVPFIFVGKAFDAISQESGRISVLKGVALVCSVFVRKARSVNSELGDLGVIAKACRSPQPLMRRPVPLTVTKVFDTFRLIAKESGKDSQEKKKNHIMGLLVAATDCELQYLICLLQTKLRIGLAEQTLLVALGHAAVYSEKHSSPPAKVDNPLEELTKLDMKDEHWMETNNINNIKALVP
ncbi:hypothetical protein OROGR_027679 [Orobanche gracilis]